MLENKQEYIELVEISEEKIVKYILTQEEYELLKNKADLYDLNSNFKNAMTIKDLFRFQSQDGIKFATRIEWKVLNKLLSITFHSIQPLEAKDIPIDLLSTIRLPMCNSKVFGDKQITVISVYDIYTTNLEHDVK